MLNITLQMAEQYFRALQMFAKSLDEEKAMEVAYMYDPWEIGKPYSVGDFVTYGVNGVDDPQLYKVVQAHTSQADWRPDITPALYVFFSPSSSAMENFAPLFGLPATSLEFANTTLSPPRSGNVFCLSS